MKGEDKYLYHLVVEFQTTYHTKRSYCIALEEKINHMNYNYLKQKINDLYHKETYNKITVDEIVIVDIKELPLRLLNYLILLILLTQK
jgi:hypothetical protein